MGAGGGGGGGGEGCCPSHDLPCREVLALNHKGTMSR